MFIGIITLDSSSSSAFTPSSFEDEHGMSKSSELTGTRFAKLFYIRMNNTLLPDHNRNALEQNYGIVE